MANSDCNKILNLIPLYIDNQLSEEETDIVSRHLEYCESCKSELDFIKSIKTKSAALPDIEPSADFHKTLMEKAERKQRAKRARKFIILRRAGAGVAAAAVVALCVVNFSNVDKTSKNTTPNQHHAPATDISQIPVSLTAPVTKEAQSPEKSTATPENGAIQTDTAITEQVPADRNDLSSGGGSSAKAPDIAEENQLPSMLSSEDIYTVATVTVTEEIKSAVDEILSSYEQDEKGYKVPQINTVLRQLAELGATVEATTDNTIASNYIIIN